MDKEYEIAKALAVNVRSTLRIPVIGVTGSVGKTSMKELLVTLLGGSDVVVHNEGSRNIAQTMVLNVLSIKPVHCVAVFEFGVDAPGQMEEMVGISMPTIPVFTGISESHLKQFGTIDEIYREKRKLLLSMPRGGKIIANGEDRNLMKFLSEDEAIEQRHVLTYGLSKECTVYADEVTSLGPLGYQAVIHGERLGVEPFSISTKLIGRSMLLSMVGAIMIALLFHVDVESIKERAMHMDFIPHRMQLIQTEQYDVIDDTYNASVVSMCSALECLKKVAILGEKRRRVAIIGDMLELGDYEVKAHEIVGRHAYECADVVVCIGELSGIIYDKYERLCREYGKPSVRYHFQSVDDFLPECGNIIAPKDVILIKASNRMGLERIVKMITEEAMTSCS